MIALFASLSFAMDGLDGPLLPGASALDAGHGHIAGFGTAGAVLLESEGSYAGGQFGIGLTNRIAVFGLVGRTSLLDGPVGLHQASVRLHAVSTDAFNLALFLTHQGAWRRPHQASLGVGLALEGGGERVRYDVTVPTFVGVRTRLREGDWGLGLGNLVPGFDLGVTFGTHRVSRLRLGFPASFTWQVRGRHLFFDLSVTPLVVVLGASARVGVRF